MEHSRSLAVAIALSALVTADMPFLQAQDYPSRAVTIVVPFAAGGSTDTIGRVIAQKLTDQIGKPFVVENKGGAGSMIGATAVSKAVPDGYTLLLATNAAMALNPTLSKNPPFDAEKDFVPLALVAQGAFFLIANPSLPLRSVADLISLAKEKPKFISFASSGVGSVPHIFMEMFTGMTKIELTHVPYRGSAPAMTDVIAGHVSVMFTDPALGVEVAKSGKARVLGVSSVSRHASALQIEPISQAVPGYDAVSWIAIVAPAKTPSAIVRRLQAELRAVIEQPDFKRQLGGHGFDLMEISGDEAMQGFVKSEIERWRLVLLQAGLAGSQ